MIWYFIAGFISGAAGWHLLISRIGARIIKKQQMGAFKNDRRDL